MTSITKILPTVLELSNLDCMPFHVALDVVLRWTSSLSDAEFCDFINSLCSLEQKNTGRLASGGVSAFA